MDQLKELLFERPATIYAVLAAVEVVVLAVWAWRRTPRCKWAALAAPGLAVVVGLIAHYVQSDGEKIAAALDEAIAHIEAGDVDAAAACLDSEFTGQGSRGKAVPRDTYVEVSKRILNKWPVKKIARQRLETQIAGNSAMSELDTRIISKRGDVINRATWQLTWIRRREGWRVTSLKAIHPQWLARALEAL